MRSRKELILLKTNFTCAPRRVELTFLEMKKTVGKAVIWVVLIFFVGEGKVGALGVWSLRHLAGTW